MLVLLLALAAVLSGSAAGRPTAHTRVIAQVPPSPREADTWCPLCEQLVVTGLDELPANNTVAELEQLLSSVCDVVGGNSTTAGRLCDEAVATAVTSLAAFDVSSAAKYTATDLCQLMDLCAFSCCSTPTAPEQIHLALTTEASEMRVTWATFKKVESVVNYGTDASFGASVAGTAVEYSAAGWRGYVHTAVMTGLQPGTKYYYQVGDPEAQNLWRKCSWSYPPLFFTQPLSGAAATAATVNVAFVGDMGATDASDATILRLGELRTAGKLDAVAHIGDISYADGVQRLQAAFLRKIESVSAYVPYMTAPGNHEGFFAFVPYTSSYPMPYNNVSAYPVDHGGQDTPRMFYSYNMGPVHVVVVSTEAAFGLLPADIRPGTVQYQFLHDDLVAASLPAARAQQPWIVVMMHRPMRCCNTRHDCNKPATSLREDLGALFDAHNVDLVVAGHVHSYESTWPVSTSAETNHEMHNAAYPVYVLNGASGTKELLMNGFPSDPPAWSRSREPDVFGFSVMTANATSLRWQFVNDESGDVLDDWVLTKDV